MAGETMGARHMRSGITRRHGRLSHRALLACVLFSVLVGCSFTYVLTTSAATYDSANVLLSANRLERLVVDLETGQLGYVATGDRKSLHPWNNARAAFPGQAEALRRLAARSSPTQAKRADQIVETANAYVREHAEPLVKIAKRDPKAARTLVAHGEGRRRIDAIRRQFDRFAEAQHQISTAHERDAIPAVRRMFATAAGTAGSLLAIFLLLGYMTRTSVRARRRTGAAAVWPPSPAHTRWHEVERLRRIAEEERALRRVATLVAGGGAPPAILGVVTGEAGPLLAADHTLIDRRNADTLTTVARWSAGHVTAPPLDEHRPVEEEAPEAVALRTGRPVRAAVGDDTRGRVGGWARAHGIGHIVCCPITADDRPWGLLTVLSRSADADTERLAGELARLAGLAIGNAERRATADASRARLVDASDAARHRIERALHNRTQQRLVSIALELRTVEAGVPPEMERLKERLSGAARSLSDTVEELQEVARDLHPSIIARGGLEAALRTLGRRSAVPVEFDVSTDRLPDLIAVTVYQIVAEALANAAAYARATVVLVGLRVEDRTVRLSVRDDGVGGADPANGAGLNRLIDRTEALGGVMRIDSPAGEGTVLRVTIPVRDDRPPPLVF